MLHSSHISPCLWYASMLTGVLTPVSPDTVCCQISVSLLVCFSVCLSLSSSLSLTLSRFSSLSHTAPCIPLQKHFTFFLPLLCHTHTHARARARTHARTHTHSQSLTVFFFFSCISLSLTHTHTLTHSHTLCVCVSLSAPLLSFMYSDCVRLRASLIRTCSRLQPAFFSGKYLGWGSVLGAKGNQLNSMHPSDNVHTSVSAQKKNSCQELQLAATFSWHQTSVIKEPL